ncbi:MAG: HPP family protein [Spirochaetaceae bacterium]|nr:HPP family protein [Spirochaetaceae bacterium]
MLEKFKNDTALKLGAKTLIFAFCGGFITILALSFISSVSDYEFFIAPFGATCVLTFAAWEAPFSQPKNVIGGHFISSLIGLIISSLFGNSPLSLALGVALALTVMILTKTVHPPAGADPIIIILEGANWKFLLFPVLTGCLILAAMSILLNRFVFRRDYPKFWF